MMGVVDLSLQTHVNGWIEGGVMVAYAAVEDEIGSGEMEGK